MRQTSASDHSVRFYDRDEDLCAIVSEFAAEGLAADERVLLLVTQRHFEAVASRLAALGVDTARAVERRDLMHQDADGVMHAIIRDGAADVDGFRALMMEALAAVRPPVRVFGEVVSLLAARGLLASALEIEEVGHSLAETSGIRVLCGYQLSHFAAPGDRERVAAAHDRVEVAPVLNECERPLLLLAEDFEDTRVLYSEFLELRGYRVVTAVDGVEAIEKAAASRPDAILMDVRMPRMNGVEAVEVLRRDPGLTGVPIVALTAHALEPERARFLSGGFTAVITKPCLPEDLERTVAALLRQSTPGSSPA